MTMQLTPTIKGQLTKALNNAREMWNSCEYIDNPRPLLAFQKKEIARVFLKIMPREQAKHAARRYLRQVGV